MTGVDPRLENKNWRTLDVLMFDVETTGIDFDDPDFKIVQFASILHRNGEFVKGSEVDILINPGVPIPRETSELHGIYDEHVADAPLFKDVATDIMHTLLSADILCAFNHTFDKRATNLEFERCGLGEIIMPYVDPLVWIREWTGKMSGNSLSAIGKRYGCSTMGSVIHGVDGIKLHDALSDVYLLGEVLLAMSERLPYTLGKLVEQQGQIQTKHDAYFLKRYGDK